MVKDQAEDQAPPLPREEGPLVDPKGPGVEEAEEEDGREPRCFHSQRLRPPWGAWQARNSPYTEYKFM